MPTLVQSQTNSIGTSSTTLTITLNTTPQTGNLLVFTGGGFSQGISSISGGGVTWSRVTHTATFHECEIWYGPNASGSGTTTITITMVAADTSIGGCVAEFSGIVASPLGQSNTGNAASATTINSPSITPAQSGELVVALAIQNGTTTITGPSGGYTSLANFQYTNGTLVAAYFVQGASAATSTSWTSNIADNYDTGIVSFISLPVVADPEEIRDGAHVWAALSYFGRSSVETLEDFNKKIILPPPSWDTDADEQFSNQEPRLNDRLADDSWTRFIVLPPPAWDTDADEQTAQPSWYSNRGSDVREDNSLLIILPAPAWDTDADEQMAQPPSYANLGSDVRDDNSLLIVLPPPAWDTDADMQKLQPPSAANIASDSGDDGADFYWGWSHPPFDPSKVPWDGQTQQEAPQLYLAAKFGSDMLLLTPFILGSTFTWLGVSLSSTRRREG